MYSSSRRRGICVGILSESFWLWRSHCGTLLSNTTSLRVAGGLVTIARVVSDGAEVYRDKLSVADAEHRLDQVYYPYHAALAETLNETRDKFGFAVLIDCHSMPSVGGPMDRDGGLKRRAADARSGGAPRAA